MTFHVLIPDSVHPSAVQILQEAGLNVTAPGQMTRCREFSMSISRHI